jgi:hypothetical protein
MWDFVMDKSVARAGFLRELRFPLPIYIPSASPQSSSLSPEAGTIGRSGCSANSLTIQDLKKVMLLSHHQNVRKNHDIKIADRCFENVAQFKYFNSNLYYLCAESTAIWPITDTAQCRYK